MDSVNVTAAWAVALMQVNADAGAASGCRLIQINMDSPNVAIIDREVIQMPYATNAELPPAVRNHLPTHAQDIFREAFDAAWINYADNPRREEIAFRVAWAAVKKGYVKVGADWIERSDSVRQ
jgi:cation transport regulator